MKSYMSRGRYHFALFLAVSAVLLALLGVPYANFMAIDPGVRGGAPGAGGRSRG